MQAECIVEAGAALGEGPVWDAARGVLWWVDIVNGLVHRYDPATGADRTTAVGAMVGAVALRPDGTLLLAAQRRFAVLDPDTDTLTPLETTLRLPEDVRFNDGKLDAAGRFWVGTMALDQSPGRGELFCLHPDLRVERKLAGLTISNGLGWSPDGGTMYLVDSPTRCVFAFDFDLDRAEIGYRRVVVRVPESLGFPDGLALDAEGMLWVAHYGASSVVRWDPDTGERMDQVRLPVEQATSCAFGGEHLDQLYITTGRENFAAEDAERWPLAGGLFRAEVGVRGQR